MSVKKINESTNDSRIAVLENTCHHILDTLSRVENKLMYMDDKIEGKLTSLENKIELKLGFLSDKMDKGFKDVNNRLWTNFFWKLSAFAALLAVMAHGFQWI